MDHVFNVQIYYEDTDLSGVVYHANYLRYFERAREHLLGVDALVRLWNDQRIGFVVYKAGMTFREGAALGDTVEIRTRVTLESEFRLVFEQNAFRTARAGAAEEPKILVEGSVDLVCVDGAKKLTRLPELVLTRLKPSL